MATMEQSAASKEKSKGDVEKDVQVEEQKSREEEREAKKMRKYKPLQQVGNFLSNLDDYDPTIPESLTKYYMNKSGIEAKDQRMVKLISLATDHFLAKTIFEAKQLTLLRHQLGTEGGRAKGTKRIRDEAAELEDILQLDDLERALREQGVNLHKRC